MIQHRSEGTDEEIEKSFLEEARQPTRSIGKHYFYYLGGVATLSVA
jgi:hypothetical protein